MIRILILLFAAFSANAQYIDSYNLFGAMYATGGTVTESGGYRIHTFTASGTLTVTSAGKCDILVVAGGGKAGVAPTTDYITGGGGAGGVIVCSDYSVASGSVSVTIGAGGTSATRNGEDSALGAIIAKGGGQGGFCCSGTSQAAQSGGSGGGGHGGDSGLFSVGATNLIYTSAGCTVYGNAGANGNISGTLRGGGGGGAGGAASGNSGGTGLSNSFSGSAVTYAAGGQGGLYTVAPAAGAANTGNGGKGSGTASQGGNGGSGIVIVRYKI